jgi:NUMOD3 motif
MTEPSPRKRGPMSFETKAKISAGLTGKHLSDATKAKLSAALIGKPRPAGIREKIRARHKARGNTEQHLRRLHSVGGRTGVAGRLNRGRRWVTELRSNHEFYLDPAEAQAMVDSGESRWGRRRRRHRGPGTRYPSLVTPTDIASQPGIVDPMV